MEGYMDLFGYKQVSGNAFNRYTINCKSGGVKDYASSKFCLHRTSFTPIPLSEIAPPA